MQHYHICHLSLILSTSISHLIFGSNMGTWLLFIISICLSISVSLLLKFIFNIHFLNKNHKLPPGRKYIPIISTLLQLRMSPANLEPILKPLHAKLGPIVTLYYGTRPVIFVADRTLAYRALIQNGAVYADRPTASPTQKAISGNQQNVSLAFYGPTWRLLRRNMTEVILHPSRAKSYSHLRRWVLQILQNRLESAQAKSGDVAVCVRDHFQFAMFGLLAKMCFGDNVDENQINQIQEIQRRAFLNFPKFNVLNLWPSVTKILLRKRWQEFFQLLKSQQVLFIPLIRARKKMLEEEKTRENKTNTKDDHVLSYVDTLLALKLPDDQERKLNEVEICNLCDEFLNAGSDTTTTAFEWIMANLVKYPQIQEQLFTEIKEIVGNGAEEVKESDLQKMPYLKAVIFEGLRRHPPGRFVLQHAVTKEEVLDGYLIPKNAGITFMVGEMGWDPNVWEDPMAFKPDRFMNNGRNEFDITGSREIKMMPFGVGRRICPGYRLAMLHLEYFVANMIWKYEWKAVDGDEIDLSEQNQRTVAMKKPLQAHISPRF